MSVPQNGLGRIAEAVLSDPSIHFIKQPAFLGRKKRRWFVLHRASHVLAYYALPFIPPQKGALKGVINLAEIVDVNAFGARLEIKVARGRSAYKLLADSEKVARDWAALIRIEAHTSGLANPLNAAVQKATTTAAAPEDSLYTEYGGFKFANENPELYTDYNPGNSPAPANAIDDADEHDNGDLYGATVANDNVDGELYGGTVANDAVVDGSYLEMPVPDAAAARPAPPSSTPSKTNNDDGDDVIGAFQAAIDDKNAYLTMPAADPAAAADTGADDPVDPAVYDEAGPGTVPGEEPKAADEAADEAAPEAAADPAVYDEAGPGTVPGEVTAVPDGDPAEDDGLYDNAGPDNAVPANAD